jgi:hypothetical protein
VYLIVFNVKGDAPVSRDGNAPRATPVAGKLMNAPAGRAVHVVQVLRDDQRGKNVSNSVHKIGTNAACVVVFNEAP